MHRIKLTVLTKDEAHKIIHSKEFSHYRNRAWGEIIKASRKYVNDYAQKDAHMDDHEHNRGHKYGKIFIGVVVNGCRLWV